MSRGVFAPPVAGDSEKTIVRSQEIVQIYGAGELLFSQGDAGGDLLFIESGSIEIFITKNGQTITLAEMNAGEIIGVMTFLTKDARLASARAVTSAQIKRIPSQHVQKLIAGFPKWLSIVMKEFVGRINEMNRRYSEVTVELKKSRDMQITPLFLATQMAQSLALVAKGMSKNQDGVDIVFIEELQEKMEAVLNQPKEMTEMLFEIFHSTGLLKIEIEPERKRKIYQVPHLEKVGFFTQFVRESTQGSTRKIMKAKLSHREIRVIKAICKFAMNKGNPPEQSGVVKAVDLASELRKMTGVDYDREALNKPAKLGLLVLNGDAANLTISLTPLTILRTLACVEAMRRLTGEDDGSEYDDGNEPSAA